jgi:hypothetical protein
MLPWLQRIFRVNPQGLTVRELAKGLYLPPPPLPPGTYDPRSRRGVWTHPEARHFRPKHIKACLDQGYRLGAIRAEPEYQRFRYWALPSFFELTDRCPKCRFLTRDWWHTMAPHYYACTCKP